jgi:hypothetical protein
MTSNQRNFKTFAVTVRPANGVTDEQIKCMLKWVKKNCEYYHVVTEKEDFQRHIHAGIVLKKETTRSNIGNRVKNLFKELDTNEKRVLLRGIKIMYNEDFMRNYLDKDDDTVVIESHLPEVGHLESYFPPKPVESDGRTRKCSAYYHQLEKLWYEHTGPHLEICTENARNFLFKIMYSERCIPVIRDDKQIVQTARHLVRWLKKAEESTIVLAPFESEE